MTMKEGEQAEFCFKLKNASELCIDQPSLEIPTNSEVFCSVKMLTIDNVSDLLLKQAKRQSSLKLLKLLCPAAYNGMLIKVVALDSCLCQYGAKVQSHDNLQRGSFDVNPSRLDYTYTKDQGRCDCVTGTFLTASC